MNDRNKFFNQLNNYINKEKNDIKKPLKKTPFQTFSSNLPKNITLAALSIFPEGLVLNRIEFLLNNPNSRPISYLQILQTKNFWELFAGPFSRTAYCLSGTFATVYGMDYFGDDYAGMVKIAAAKNGILPIFLFSNARQMNRDYRGSFIYTFQGIKMPVIHWNFFLRNLLANTCLWPGLQMRDYIFQKSGESETTLATFIGLFTSVTLSGSFNSFLKPFITGTNDQLGNPFDLVTRYKVARRFPALSAMILREIFTIAIPFFNSSPKGRQAIESENKTIKPSGKF